MNDALQRIEILRQSLYTLVQQHDGDLLHPAVVAASQHLDAAVCTWQQTQPKAPILRRSETAKIVI